VASLLAWRRSRRMRRCCTVPARSSGSTAELWDAMVVAAAQLQDCALLLTEDLHDGAVFGAVTVRSPFTLGVEEARRPMHRRARPRCTVSAVGRSRRFAAEGCAPARGG